MYMQLSIHLLVYQQSTQQSKRCINQPVWKWRSEDEKLGVLDGGMGISFCTNEMNDLPTRQGSCFLMNSDDVVVLSSCIYHLFKGISSKSVWTRCEHDFDWTCPTTGEGSFAYS
jgi:hypothetical protein